MKPISLSLLALSAVFFSGCETYVESRRPVAVRRHSVGYRETSSYSRDRYREPAGRSYDRRSSYGYDNRSRYEPRRDSYRRSGSPGVTVRF